MMLRDFLPKGRDDRAANSAMTSRETEKLERLNLEKGRTGWGCVCGGHLSGSRGGDPLQCKSCDKWFHPRCERLDYSSAELAQMAAKRTFICASCESQAFKDAGYDPSKGRFVWHCKFCARQFEDERTAELHGRKCSNKLAKREWSCPCNGEASAAAKSGAGAAAVLGGGSSSNELECEACGKWFHRGCKKRARGEWEQSTPNDNLCLKCERSGARPSGTAGLERTGAPCGADAVTSEASVRENRLMAAARAAKRAKLVADQERTLSELLPLGEEEVGCTLREGSIFVAPSGLGSASGLGLYAARSFSNGEKITSYAGPILYREQIEAGAILDTSYVLRIPNSGGALIDGKPYADAIRANRSNPGAWGRYYPVEDAPEWDYGAASMANDPRNVKMYNSKLDFKRRQGVNKALCELAPMRAILFATRDIKAGEEIFYNYGSEKPFEKMHKEMQRRKTESLRKKQEVVRVTWVPYEDAK